MSRHLPKTDTRSRVFPQQQLSRRAWDCTRTHLLHAHFCCCTHTLCTLHTSHACEHTRMVQARKKCWSHAHVVLLSFLMFHPSLLLSFLLFLDGHFETTPDYDLTDFDVHDFLPNFPDLNAQVKRTPHEDELCGYLARSAVNTGTRAHLRRRCDFSTQCHARNCGGRLKLGMQRQPRHQNRLPE